MDAAKQMLPTLAGAAAGAAAYALWSRATAETPAVAMQRAYQPPPAASAAATPAAPAGSEAKPFKWGGGAGAPDTGWAKHPGVTCSVHEQLSMRGQVVLVTGGGGWLGTAFCQCLAELGATVVVGSRSAEKAVKYAALLPCGDASKGQPALQHHGVALDHMDEASLRAGFASAVKVAGQVDAVVNNGVWMATGDIATGSYDDFCAVQRNNAGYFFLAKCLRDHVVERGVRGSVVNIGSMYGQVASYPDAYTLTDTPWRPSGKASPVSYHCLKGGTIHLTRHMAAYWALDGVRVNCLSPGPFPSPNAPADMVGRLCAKLPMKRMGSPAELKGALALLVSDAGSFMTGQNLTVDGGWTAW